MLIWGEMTSGNEGPGRWLMGGQAGWGGRQAAASLEELEGVACLAAGAVGAQASSSSLSMAANRSSMGSSAWRLGVRGLRVAG